ncbi:MAG: ribbon-helix-helix domain-containing protein [Flavobacteriales bacterium]|nr:ribbon-helix-helix domain-containing protein [Flavobacteriales bacterium]
MTTFTSTLPDNILQLLHETAKKLAVPKNKLIEKALTIYLDQLNKAEYIKSYKEMADDRDVQMIAEEGMAEYLTQLNSED